jgi:hypothetical protein
MKKILYIGFLLLFPLLGIQAQDNCEKNLKKVKQLLEKKSPFTTQKHIFSLLEPCALQGDGEAENRLGMFYLNGIGTDKDITKAFTHISNAANKGYANAQYNLGRLYKYGEGCEINFIKAIEWFEKATANGNQRAAYSLGYMYYKGFGVAQNYKKAVNWFEQSDDPMASHFLAICYYLGYGVAVDENKSIELLLTNPTINSKTFLNYVKANQKEKNEDLLAQVLESNIAQDSTHISEEVIEEVALETYTDEKLTKKEINGEWVGKLLQYDWSGKHIQRILPIELIVNEKNGSTAIKLNIEDQSFKSKIVWQDQTMYLENHSNKFTLKKLYSSSPKELTLDYNLFSIGLQKIEFEETNFLTGSVDSYIP